MKKSIIFAALTIFLLALATPAHAEGPILPQLDLDALGRSAPQNTDGLLQGISPVPGISLDDGLGSILTSVSGQAGGIFREGIKSVVLVLIIILLCGVLGTFFEAPGSRIPSYVNLTGVFAVASVMLADINGVLQLGRQAISDMEGFSKTLLITLASASALAGSPVASGARHMATMLFSDVLLSVISGFIVPMLYAYIAVCVANAALGGDTLLKVATFIKWACISALAGILLIFTAYLTISGVISGQTDILATKAAKLTMSSFVPVVGGIISDAAEAVVAGAGIVKNAVGIFGLLVILATCLAPFLRMGIQYLLFKAASAVSSPIASPGLVKLVDSLGGAFSIMLGMTGACALLMFIAIISTLTAAHG